MVCESGSAHASRITIHGLSVRQQIRLTVSAEAATILLAFDWLVSLGIYGRPMRYRSSGREHPDRTGANTFPRVWCFAGI